VLTRDIAIHPYGRSSRYDVGATYVVRSVSIIEVRVILQDALAAAKYSLL
jgi:hypothetical protein